MNDSQTHPSIEGIAVIGMSGRFPKSPDLAAFWQNLQNGVECITFFSDEELMAAGVDATLLNHPNYVKAKGILDRVEYFDASFFGLNPREAEIIDPQHRIFLECVWEALENAGYDPYRYAGMIGVYAGATMNTYLIANLLTNPELLATVGGYQAMLGNDKDFMPTRVSYKLNLRGPSVNVQTACSTSLVAVQMACQSLLNYQCDMAVAGGVSVTLPHRAGYLYQEGMILSPDGHCRAFDAAAQGTVSGEGAGVVILKRLADALADGDSIRAVIKGTAINNDGSLKVGYTAPSVDGQAEAITMAQAAAGVEAESITYLETHGTGTPLGDPIEIAALTQTFRASAASMQRTGFCAIGSVKTNIGHLDAAAGVAGLIKTVLALQHKLLPPSLHFQQPNPKIDFANSPFYVNAQLTRWETDKLPRRAGVSSFGIGGTNAHVVVEEAPELPAAPSLRRWQLLVLSARTEPALDRTTQNLAQHLRQHPDVNLADAAYTLQVGRRPFAHRRIVVCQNTDDAATVLETPNARCMFTAVAQETPDVAFMFTGQGAQYVNMGLELYRTEATFREQVDRCAEILRPHLGLDLRDVLYPGPEQAEWAARQIHQTAITQSALFVIEYALSQLWMEWGVRPQAMIGHSIGEYVAACLAGVFSLPDALGLVAARGRLMQSLPRGAMLAVSLAEQEARLLLEKPLSLAVVNAPSLCVVSGPVEKVDALQHLLEERGVQCRRLLTSHAFHSAMMDPILDTFATEVGRIELHPPAIPFVSNVTGTWITTAQATDSDYWATHLRQTVRFSDGVRELAKQAGRILLEVGPGQTLNTLAQQQPNRPSNEAILSSLRHPNDPRPDTVCLLETLGRLWLAGVDVHWSALYAMEQRRRIALPTYPFERQRFWVEPAKLAQPAEPKLGSRALQKKQDIADWFYIPSWQRCMLPNLHLQTGGTLDGAGKSHWLMFSDACGLGPALAERLARAGHTVTAVCHGSHFNKSEDGTYILNPRQPEDYGALIRDLRVQEKMPDVVLHLWNFTGDERTSTGEDSLRGSLDLGFYSLLFLTQALGEHGFTGRLQMNVISNNIHEVTGEEELDPVKATTLGPVRVIPQEYPGITCRNIDVTSPRPGTAQQSELVEAIMAELFTMPGDPIIAYRGRYRWVQTFEAYPLKPANERPAILRPGGVYLIIGGLGGIGMVLAEYLAQAGPVKLVFTGRSEFPKRDEWPQLLATHDDQHEVSRRIRGIQALEAQGAEVLVYKANAANLDEMRVVVARAREHFGAIHGVIHAAGLPASGLIQSMKDVAAAQVLAPKLLGTLALSHLFGDRELDFLVLCSSTSAILGGNGLADYSASNAFLDAFACDYRAKHGTLCMSISWDTWREVGMAANAQVPAHLQKWKEENLKKGLLSSEGKEAFSRILHHPVSQVIVSPRDLGAVIAQAREFIEANLPEASNQQSLQQSRDPEPVTSKPEASNRHPRPAMGNPYVAPGNDLEQSIATIWQDLLGIEPVGIHDDFFELGGHSLLAVQVISRLRETFHVELPLRSLFEATTVQDLAQRLKTILWVVQEQRTSPADDGADREEIEL